MTFPVALLFSLMSCFCHAGYIDYYKLVNEGEYQMYEGHYELAISNFEVAFDLVNQPKARDYFLVSKCFAQLNNHIEVYHYLQLAVENNLNKEYIIADSLWFTNQAYSSEFKTILKLKPIVKKPKEDSSIAFNRLKEDFKLNHIIQFYKYTDKKDTTSKDYLKFMEKYIPYRDSFKLELIQFCLNDMLPSTTKELNRLHFFCLHFLHQDLTEYDAIKNRFKGFINSGEITPMFYAETFDRIVKHQSNNIKNTKSEFGIFEASIKQTDLMKTIEKRLSIGLSQYYYDAPNYGKNYKPISISKSIREVDYEIIDYD